MKKLLIILSCVLISTTASAKTAYIGDSRFEMMKEVVKDKSIIAKSSMGYNWFKGLDLSNYDTLVVNLGINDLGNIRKYTRYYKKLIKSGKKLYLVSVNPVEEDKERMKYFVSNKSINKFNRKLKRLNCKYINTNKNLRFNTTDGVHYDNKTSKKIYKYIKKRVK